MSLESTTQDMLEWAEASKSEYLTLPSTAYTDSEWFDKEMETVFGKEWLFVGVESEVAEINDFFTVDLYDKPLIVTRDRSGTVRAFANVCPHRSMILAEGSGNKPVFTCPYHAWSFQTDGRLRGAPHFTGQERERVKDVCLTEYRVEIWNSLIFVTFDENVEPLAPRLINLEPRYAPYDLKRYKAIVRETLDYKCNWKTAIENFCESFHIFRVHPITLEPIAASASIDTFSGGDYFASSMVRANEPEPPEYLERMPEALEGIQLVGSIFPILGGSAVTPSTAVWFAVSPNDVSSTVVTMIVATYVGEGWESHPREQIEAIREQFVVAIAEDAAIIPRAQRGLVANPRKFGKLHQPFEQPVWELAHYMARTVIGVDVMERPEGSQPWPPAIKSYEEVRKIARVG